MSRTEPNLHHCFTVSPKLHSPECVGISVKSRWKMNEFFCFESKISLKTRTNPSFPIFHDHEGARDLNVPVCLRLSCTKMGFFVPFCSQHHLFPFYLPQILNHNHILIFPTLNNLVIYRNANTIIHTQRAWSQGTFVFLSVNKALVSL